ncbi:ATP:cob(I)alamin adenosyltransferase [Desulfonema ishimotonii]|uniref:Corrinoid adenosyltransferase n=1 Tax=Desulfonema ishimotonii TaxID=45657 RepID=A0A401FXE0_9BACT|nr:cob(I)yrinic acid a,c-diamide adenosyltransferase [Desulfonema ishimotonii]GBC61604.1 ATP:cob(I)alamin adenosyltransferase [Desulfonema ishimotonii]
MKVYTGGGDRGKTSLFSGERVSKCHDQVEAYGEIDELNSVLGAITAAMPETMSGLVREIRDIQSDLLAVGALLATTPDSASIGKLEKFDAEKPRALEAAIDRMDAELPPLKAFILPGGHMTAAWAHIARTVCRRAERRIISLTPPEHLREALVYINRLSDYLFVLARYCNHLAGVADVPWRT